MTEQLHRLDGDQLALLVSALKPPKSRGLNLDRLLALAQLVAILVGGLWALYEYLSFRRENARLSLQQQQFTVAQQKITKQQQELALETGKITFGLQRVQSQLAEEQLAETHERRQVVSCKLDTKKITRSTYEVDVSLKLTNNADKKFTITYSLVELFVADPASVLKTNHGIVQITPPPYYLQRVSILSAQPLRRADSEAVLESTLHWRKVADLAHVFEDGRMPGELDLASYLRPQIGGGGTGPLRKGETAEIGVAYMIRDKPTTWVGAVVYVGFDDGPGQFWRRFAQLAD